MSIEYRVVSIEKSPFEGGDERSERGMTLTGTVYNNYKGLPESTLRESSPPSKRCTRLLIPPASRRRDYNNPLSRGDLGVCLFEHRVKNQEHSPRAANQTSSFCLHFFAIAGKKMSPLERGLWVPTLILLLAIITTFTQTITAQTNTPPPDRNELPGYSPQGETLYPQLEEYLQIAIEQNPELQSLRSLYDSQQERVREVGVLMDPEITVAYDFNPMMYDSYLGRFSISAMQMFPWFGSLDARREIQRSAANVNQSRVDSRQLEILRDVQLFWLDIAETYQQIRIAEENLELIRDLEKLVEVRYETGRAGQADILRIQMEEQRLKTRIADLEDRINPMKARFNELLNRDAAADIETTDRITIRKIPYSDDESRSLISQLNPLFDGIEAEKSAAEKQRRLADLDGRPSFGLGLEVMGRDFGPMSMFPDSKESIIGMATVRVPLFRSRYSSQQRQADHQIRAISLQRDQTENRLMTELEQYLEEIRSSERTIHLLDEELVPRAEQALRILSEEYSTGNARFDELLQIQRELLELEIERVETVVNQNKAVVRIESLMGNGQ
jgi:outer membrane protein, heavy metal efflux system